MSSSANTNPGADWYRNPDLLLSELGRSRAARGDAKTTIPGYDDLTELRRGGQGVVYKAVQRSTRRAVAIKLLLDGSFASPTTRRRFEREIDLAAGLRHPNIVSVYDSGVTPDGRMYFVMEYIDGVTLDQWILDFGSGKRGNESAAACLVAPLPRCLPPQSKIQNPKSKIDAALRLFAKICDAVQYAHQHGVIHRDLKPANIRIDKEGEPRVLDFGLAKAARDELDGHSATALSLTGQFMGSLPWSSPEQAEGDPSKIDVRTDVYALGVMLYELLTGRFPYPVTGTFREVLDNILRVEPFRPRALVSDLDADLETIVLRCLAKEPERRYQSAGDLARDLRRHLAGEPIEARRDSAWYAVRKTVRRYKLAAAFSSALLILAVAFTITMSFLYRRAVNAEQLAERRRVTAEQETQRAVQAEQLAEQRRATAEQETDKTRRAQKFLQTTLTSLDPEKARGRDVTVLHDLLDEAAGRVEKEFSGQPEVAAGLHYTIAMTYWSLGDYPAAERHLRAELQLWKFLRGDDAPETLNALSNLALLLENAGRCAEAGPLARQAYEASRRVRGAEHPDTITALSTLADVFYNTGELARAEELYREVFNARRRVLGEEHPDTLKAKNNLALCLLYRGDLAAAEPMLREVLAARQRLLGNDHLDTLNARNNFGRLLSELGRLDEAEPLLRGAADDYRRVFGERHPLTLAAQGNVARLLLDTGREAEAEMLQRQTLERTREALGAEHPDTLQALNNLAFMLQKQGRLDEAEPLLRAALETWRRRYGAEHPSTLTVLNNLANLLSDRGQAAEAEPLLRQVLDARRRVLGETHVETLQAKNNLAGSLRDRGALGEALKLYEETWNAVHDQLPTAHPLRVVVQNGLGGCLTRLRRFEEAEKHLLESYQVIEAAGVGPLQSRRELALRRLIDLYRAWDKPERAAEYQAALK